MKKVLRRIAILAAPIVWRKIRGRRGRHHWHGHRHRHPHYRGHKRPGVWL